MARLVEPLDSTRTVLHHLDYGRYRRAGAHAVAVVLQHCATPGRAYWGWSAWDWATVCSPSSQAFRAAQPLPTETTVRPFVMALAHLLGELSQYQHLGNFDRVHLAKLVFGAEPVEHSMSQAFVVMQRWDYLSQTGEQGRYRLPGVLNRPGMFGDFEPWEGWGRFWEHVEEVPAELKARAVRMVAEVRADHGSGWAAMAKVAQLLGVTTPESVRKLGAPGRGRPGCPGWDEQ